MSGFCTKNVRFYIENVGFFRLKTPEQLLADGSKVSEQANTHTLEVFTGLNHSLSWKKHMGTVSAPDTEEGQPSAVHSALLTYRPPGNMYT